MNTASRDSPSARTDLAVTLLALFVPALLTWPYFIVPASATFAIYGMNKVFQVVFPLVWLRLVMRRELRFGGVGMRPLLEGALSGSVIAAAVAAAYACLRHTGMFHELPSAVAAKLSHFMAVSPGRFAVFAVFIALGNSLVEEFFWRWFVFGNLRRHKPMPVALLASSVAFTFHHAALLTSFFSRGDRLQAVLLLSAATGIGAAIWAWVYDRTGSLAAPWLSHVMADAAVLLVGAHMLWG